MGGGIEHPLGKLPLPVPARDFFAPEIATRGYRVLDVRRAHAERAAELPSPEPEFPTRGSAAEILANLFASGASDAQKKRAEPGGHARIGDPGQRDPFVRMLVSQALVEGIPVLTVDGRLGAYEAVGLRVVR